MSKYNQIYSDLLASITTERLERGARLPSETELMDSYQASRGTVRKAIEQLQERGFAQKVHGKGTFVLSTNPIEFQLGGIVSFQETYPRLGNDVSTEVVEFAQIPLEGSLLEHIKAKEGSLITRIKRVRRIDGKRVILDINHFVSDVIPGLSRDIAEQSIYAFIEQTLQRPKPCDRGQQPDLPAGRSTIRVHRVATYPGQVLLFGCGPALTLHGTESTMGITM
jgi:GntR family trehalose operon transcriptional repressor